MNLESQVLQPWEYVKGGHGFGDGMMALNLAWGVAVLADTGMIERLIRETHEGEDEPPREVDGI